MLRSGARLGLAISAAAVAVASRVRTVAADASFVPGVSPETVRDESPAAIAVPVLLVAVVVLTVVAILRAPSRRGATGVLLGTLGTLVGGLFVLAGLFGDLSGRHEIFVLPLALGVAVIGGSIYAAWRVRRGVARSPSGGPIA